MDEDRRAVPLGVAVAVVGAVSDAIACVRRPLRGAKGGLLRPIAVSDGEVKSTRGVQR